jgi:hypothetical protein
MLKRKKILENLRYRVMDGSAAMLLALAWMIVIVCSGS